MRDRTIWWNSVLLKPNECKYEQLSWQHQGFESIKVEDELGGINVLNDVFRMCVISISDSRDHWQICNC